VTGRRRVAELAFEIVSTQSLASAADKARRLIARGVRRVFAIDVERSRALEWSASREAWQLRELGASIEDPVLAAPLPIEPLVKAAIVDDAIARALVAKNNPVIAAEKADSRRKGQAEGRQEGLAEGLAEGRLEGVRSSLLQLLAARGIPLDVTERARILEERDLRRLELWFARAVHRASLAEVLADS
jgi:flagellar biosynthesis/type III secretory pathway protein FliH